jgi:hypothetical protein
VFAYGTAFEVAGACACAGGGGWQAFGPSAPVPPHLSVAPAGSSPFVAYGLAPQLSALPRAHALRVEAWVGAVDLLLALKDAEDQVDERKAAEEDDGARSRSEGGAAAAQVKARAERVLAEWGAGGSDARRALAAEAAAAARGGHGFAPFVLRLAFVADPATRTASLAQLLQFVFVGAPAAALAAPASAVAVPPGALAHAAAAVAVSEAAVATATAGLWHQVACGASVPEAERSALTALCFAHKRLLLAEKVILDTVLPASGAKWKLRTKPKGGCGCCAPDGDTAALGTRRGPPAMTMPGAFGQPRIRRRVAAI